MVVCKHSWQELDNPDTVLQGMQPSAESLTGRPPDTVLQGMQSVFLSTKPKRTVVCKHSWQELDNPDTVLQGMQPSAESLTGRPPDTILQGMQPSARFLTG